MSKVRKPEVGDYVTWVYERLDGTEDRYTGKVEFLLATQFVLYVQGRGVPYYIFYTDEWEIVS